jgi:hypothetical protein
MGSSEVKESCVCCSVTVHQVCVTGQLVNADWSVVKDRSAVELFCCGCVVERFMEVCLLVSLLRDTGAELAIFEPIVDAFVSEKGEGVWTRCARNAVKVWACTLASKKKPPSPWAKGPKPVDSEELSPLPLALVAKPLAVTAVVPPSATGTGGGASGSGLGAGEGETIVLQRLEELQRQISRLALQGPGNEKKSPLVLYYESARFFGNASCANLVYGTLHSFSKDEEGAPNTLGFYVKFDFMGMRARGEAQKRRATRWTGGGERVDLVGRHQDCAEAKGVSEMLMLGGFELKARRNLGGRPRSKLLCSSTG